MSYIWSSKEDEGRSDHGNVRSCKGPQYTTIISPRVNDCTLWPCFPPFPQLPRPHSWVQNYSFTSSKTSQLQYKFHPRTPPPTFPPLNFQSPRNPYPSLHFCSSHRSICQCHLTSLSLTPGLLPVCTNAPLAHKPDHPHPYTIIILSNQIFFLRCLTIKINTLHSFTTLLSILPFHSKWHNIPEDLNLLWPLMTVFTVPSTCAYSPLVQDTLWPTPCFLLS